MAARRLVGSHVTRHLGHGPLRVGVGDIDILQVRPLRAKGLRRGDVDVVRERSSLHYSRQWRGVCAWRGEVKIGVGVGVGVELGVGGRSKGRGGGRGRGLGRGRGVRGGGSLS